MKRDPLLVLVLGLPSAGKTTLAERLALDLAIPRVGKDEIKELLFDHIGFEDREWSKRLGGASFELLYWSIEKVLVAGSPLIVDVDFSNPPFAARRLGELRSRLPFRLMQVNLFTDGRVLFERFKRRSLSGERHPGHVDHGNFAEFESTLLRGRREALELEGDGIEVDTTDFAQLDYESVLSAVRLAI